jgi:hypothetical protein
MSALRALSHSTLYGRWTTGASKCSAIHYVEGKTAFWTLQNMSRLRTHSLSPSLIEPLSKILKTFLETLNNSKVETSILKMIKYPIQLA